MLFCSNLAHISEIQLLCDGPTDRRTDRRTNEQTHSYRDARTHLINEFIVVGGREDVLLICGEEDEVEEEEEEEEEEEKETRRVTSNQPRKPKWRKEKRGRMESLSRSRVTPIISPFSSLYFLPSS